MNYQKELDLLVENLQFVPKLLLHSCCGPCSTTCIAYLTKYFDITILYYNPNIEPKEEYDKRKEEQIKFLKLYKSINKINMLDIDYLHQDFVAIAKGLEEEKEGGKRCHKCIELRLKKTKEVALLNNYDYFGTTLTVSPHKNSKLINEIGKFLEDENIKYLVSDFKKHDGYKKSIQMSKEYNLYRQEYCGCLYGKFS